MKIHQHDVVLVVVLILVSVTSYNIGRIRAVDQARPEIKITRPIDSVFSTAEVQPQNANEVEPESTPTPKPIVDLSKIEVVISKKSKSGVYHFPWCSGARRIKEENKVSFASEQLAITAGYRLAINCSK